MTWCRKAAQEAVKAALEIIDSFSKGAFPKALASLPGSPAYRSAWEQTIKAAEEANTPGTFTAFIGNEWTSNTGGNNLHRVVIFRDGGERASRVEPYTTLKPLGSDNPRDLWKWMATYEERTGGRDPGHRPQRQPQQRHHVSRDRIVHWQTSRS